MPGTHAGTRGSGINTNPPCDARHDSRAAPAFAIRVALPLALAVGLVLTLGASVVSAHPDRPATMTTVVAGPYVLAVGLYADPPRAGQALPVLVTLGAGAADSPTTVRLVARPGLGTNATPTRAMLGPDPDAPASFAGDVRLPVTGAWLLDVLVDGLAGPGAATLPVTAAAPGAFPLWFGWTLGLAPLLGVGWFAWWQHRDLRRLEARPT